MHFAKKISVKTICKKKNKEKVYWLTKRQPKCNLSTLQWTFNTHTTIILQPFEFLWALEIFTPSFLKVDNVFIWKSFRISPTQEKKGFPIWMLHSRLMIKNNFYRAIKMIILLRSIQRYIICTYIFVVITFSRIKIQRKEKIKDGKYNFLNLIVWIMNFQCAMKNVENLLKNISHFSM